MRAGAAALGADDGGASAPKTQSSAAVGCDAPQRLFSALVAAEGDAQAELLAQAHACGEEMADVSRKRLRNPSSSEAVLSQGLALLVLFENPSDAVLIEKIQASLGE